jgi:hypothetical protein
MIRAPGRHSGEGRNPVILPKARRKRMRVWIPARGRDDVGVCWSRDGRDQDDLGGARRRRDGGETMTRTCGRHSGEGRNLVTLPLAGRERMRVWIPARGQDDDALRGRR